MRVAVAVDHGGRPVRGPEPGLARPVGLDDVRHDDEQRVGVGRLRGEQRLGRLAETRARRRAGRCGGRPRRRRPPAPGAASAPRPPGARSEVGLGQRHAGRTLRRRPPRRSGTAGRAAPSWRAGAAARRLRGGARRSRGRGRGWRAAGRRPTAGRRGARRGRPEVASGAGCLGGRPRGRRPSSISRLSAWAASETTASSASSASSEVSRAAVFARIVAMPSRRLSCSVALGLGDLGVGLDPGALLAHQQGDDLELRRGGRLHRCRARRWLDLAHGAGEHRDDAVVVARAGTWLVPGRGTASARLALASSSHRLLLRSTRRTCAHRTTSARTHGRRDRASYGTGLGEAAPRRGPRT